MNLKRPTAVVFHRVDFDGMMSLGIALDVLARASHPACHPAVDYDGVVGRGIEMMPYTYGDPIPDLSRFERVVMVDVSFPPVEMLALRERLGRAFTWIDHHATAINASEENGYTDIPGARVNGVAACELTWRYYHSDVFVPVPMSVRLLSLYDTWTKDAEYSWENQILPFQWSLREEFGRDARKFVEEFVLSERYRYEVCVEEDILRGNIILSYARRSGCEGVAAYGFPVTIGPEKHPGVCCLTNTFGGLAFEEALREIPGTVAVCVNRLSPKEGQPEETYKVSIYAGDSKPGWHIGNYLRANYTGGGHEGAGGGYLSRAQFITLITEGRL